MGENQVKFLITAVLISTILCVPALGEKQKADFQKGQILKLEKLSGQTSAGGSAPSDAPPDPEVYRYNVFVQLGDTVYTTRLNTFEPCDTEYSPGSDVQARIGRNVLYLKRASGKVEEGSILGKKKAEAPTELCIGHTESPGSLESLMRHWLKKN